MYSGLASGWLSTSFQQRAHARNRRDQRGYPVHLICAVIGLIGLLAYDGAAEWLVMLPVCAAVIRGVATWRSLLDAVCRPISAAIVLAGLWGLFTLAWSSDRANGLDELSAFRHALLIPALWPLRDHRGVLIAALAAGFALGHLTQIGHAIGVWVGVEWLKWPRLPDRNSGWWDPVVGGSLLTAAVGLHLPAAMFGRGWARCTGVVGACAALAGVVATGTRGAWIATAALLALAAGFGASSSMRRAGRTPGMRGQRRSNWIALGLAAVTIVVAAVAAGPEVVGRAGRGVAELRRVYASGDFTSDTGRRLFMWIESWRAVTSHPLGGLGAGGLNDWAEAAAVARGLDPALVLPHAHGMWVHLAATQGLLGVAVWGVVVGVAMACGVGAWRRRAARTGVEPVVAGSSDAGPDVNATVETAAPESASADSRSGISDRRSQRSEAYSLAPAIALLGLILAGAFDTIHVNSQTAMLLFALIALCAMGRSRSP